MRTYGVIVVLFRPDRAALEHVAHAHRSSPATVVVDNTPDPDAALHARLAADGVTVLANANAGGLAGAYNRGVEHLLERDVELIFFLDQDSEIDEGYFERMTAAAETVTGPFLIGPLVYEIELDRWFPDRRPTPSAELHPNSMVISSGSAVSADAYRLAGPFREELFIEYVDTEYAVRAAQHGASVMVNTGEVLRQRMGAITVHGKHFTTNHAAPRRYYLVRNVVAMCLEYSSARTALSEGGRTALRELFRITRFEQHKRRKIVAVLLGVLDGVRRRLGRFEDNHRRAAAYCAGR